MSSPHPPTPPRAVLVLVYQKLKIIRYYLTKFPIAMERLAISYFQLKDLRYPSLHKIKFIGAETILYGKCCIAKTWKISQITSFSSASSTSLHPIVPFFAGVFSCTIYFCVPFSKRSAHGKTTNTTQNSHFFRAKHI